MPRPTGELVFMVVMWSIVASAIVYGVVVWAIGYGTTPVKFITCPLLFLVWWRLARPKDTSSADAHDRKPGNDQLP